MSTSQSHIAAVIAHTTLGSWLEDAIREKLPRDTTRAARQEANDVPSVDR